MARGSLKRREGTPNKWDGRIDVQGIDGKRKQICKTFTAERPKDAEKQFNKWVVGVQENYKSFHNINIKLKDLYDVWFRFQEVKVKQDKMVLSTKDWYKYMSRRILDALGDYKIKEIGYDQLESLYTEMADQEISPKYVYEHFALLGRLLRYAATRDFINGSDIKHYEDCLEKLDLQKKPDREDPRVFQDDEMQELLESVKKQYLLWLIITIKETGMRRSEVLGLQWKHIIFQDGEIFVEQQLYKHNKNFAVKKPKSKKGIRKIPMTRYLHGILEKHYSAQQNGKAKLDGNLNEWDYVIVNEIFERIDPNRVTEWMREAMHELDHKEIKEDKPVKWVGRGLHSVRHTFASYAIRAGVNVAELSVILGHHSKMFTLKTYAHLFENSKREAMDKIEAYRDGIQSKKIDP